MPGNQSAGAKKDGPEEAGKGEEEKEEEADDGKAEGKSGLQEEESKVDPLTVLHTGDLVLIRCTLEGGGEVVSLEGVGDELSNGFICPDSIGNCLHVVPDDGKLSLDLRDFLFIVVQQLSYTAQKDLRRRRKYVEAELSAHNTGSAALVAELQEYEKRAKFEASENQELTNRSNAGRLNYGHVFQLQHLRTKKFVGIRPKLPASLKRTARRMELQDGSMNCWIRANPAFVHKMQGEPVHFQEQLTLEMLKLGADWDIGSSRCKRKSGEVVHEVNCRKGEDTGMFFVLYSRATRFNPESPDFALGVGSVVRLFHAEDSGFITASCDPKKSAPYMRRVPNNPRQPHRFCAKDLWILELVSLDRAAQDCGIEYSHTPVLLRHYGSGRYLAVSNHDLVEQGLVEDEELSDLNLPSSPVNTRNTNWDRALSFANPGVSDHLTAELVDDPGAACMFTLEPTKLLHASNPGVKLYIPREQPTVMLRWMGGAGGENPLWLSCVGLKKGSRDSLELHWTRDCFSRDALQLQQLDQFPELWECDAIAVRRKLLQDELTPQLKQASSLELVAGICAQIDKAISDMIHFLADSILWEAEEKSKGKRTTSDRPNYDAMKVPLNANEQRQRFVRELKYMDAVFQLFLELEKKSPDLCEATVDFATRLDVMNSCGNSTAPRGTGVDENAVKQARARCLKLIVRLWMYCVLGSRENENYFYKKGWMDAIDHLNGQGLGVSDVFVALFSNNPQLVRCMNPAMVERFITFIRLMGPLDVWLSFLKAICAPQNQAVPLRQQDLLLKIIFRGHRASEADRNTTLTNRKELLIWVRLAEPTGAPLGQASPGRGPPWEGCLAQGLLTRGIHDIAVSWVHPEHWEVGRGVLYHGPKALGLPRLASGAGRSWVSLAQLTWVLQPERCCEAATGKRWEDVLLEESGGQSSSPRAATGSPFGSTASRTDLLRTLANYLLAQLQLIANIVKARQMNCIMALQEEYSFSLCLCGAGDARLPTSIRSAFYNILSNLWLDRHPHSEVVVPNLLRRLSASQGPGGEDVTLRANEHEPEIPEAWSDEHLRSLPEEVNCFYRFDHSGKLEALLQVLRNHLCLGPDVEQLIHTWIEDNMLMLNVLHCVGLLLRFGFFHSRELLSEFLGPIVRCLDGRTDWLECTGADAEPSAAGVLEEEDAHAQNEVTPLLAVRPSLSVKSREGGQGLPPAPGRRLVRSRFPPQRGSAMRYLRNGHNQAVIDAKVQMARVLLHMLQIAVDLKISQVLREFRLRGNDWSSCDFVDVVLQALDDPAVALEQLRVHSPNVMLVDLLMYEDPTLFSLVLELLFENCMKTSDFLGYLGRVKLLSQEQTDLAHGLRKEMHTLGKLIYSFENWGVNDDFSTVDQDKFFQLQGICKRVRQVCSEGEAGSTSMEIQDMLRQTEFFSHLHFALSVVPEDFIPSSRPLLAQMVATLCGAATYAVRGNPKNQELTFQLLERAAKHSDELPQCAYMLTEVFRGNLELCQQVPEALVEQFGELVHRERRGGKFRPWYLGFFCAIVAVGTVPVPRNQHLVSAVIHKLKPSMVFRLGELNESRLKTLATAFRSEGQILDPDPSTWRSTDGELIYYLRSIELLVGLARGQGSEALCNKPFVNSLYPAPDTIRLLLQVEQPPEHHSGFSIHRHLRTQWLQLLHVMVYDVEAPLFDEELLGSPLHVEFFRRMLGWLEESLDLAPADEVSSDAPPLDEGADEYLTALLRCVDAFYQSSFPLLKNYELCDSLFRVAQDAPRQFSRIVQQGPGRFVPRRGLRNPELLQTIALRTLSAVGKRVSLPPAAASPSGEEAKGRRGSTCEAQGRWQALLQTLEEDPRVKKRIEQETEELGQVLLNVADLTDPEKAEYVKTVPSEMSGTLPDGVDFRRCRVAVQDVLRRLVRHTQEPQFGGYPSLRRVLRALLAMIGAARAKDDPKAGPVLQAQFIQTGVAELVIQVLDANIAADIEANSWALLAQTLNAPSKYGGKSDLQMGLYNAMRSMDDSGLWESFQELTDVVGGSVKPMRALRRMPSLTADELGRLREYRAQVVDTCTALRVLRLMAEGHNVDMQNYLFTQAGNSRSVNVLATAVWLMTRLVKDPTDADMADELEFECVSLLLELLIEVAQGPNLRNQEFLSTLGLIEAVFKLSAAGCAQMQRADRDLYPPSVQKLKSQLVESLLALLEGRTDSTIHLTMVQRLDRHVLRERIRFVYLYFVFGAVGVSSGEVRCERKAAIPLDGRVQRLLLPGVEPSELLLEVEKASVVAEELLEDLDDEELDTLFSEGLDCLQICLELSPCSKQFEEEVMPVQEGQEKFVDDPSRFATNNDYWRERKAFHQRTVYRMSYNFLKRFVRTIEVMLQDQLQNLHFQQPLTAMWYCSSATKQRILDTVPLGTVDAKTKAFIQMCQEVHYESILIRRLSRFSILPDRQRKWAQRHLPDGMHRPFQVFLANDAKWMEQLLVIALVLSVVLAAHVGLLLVAARRGDGGPGGPRHVWVSEPAAFASQVLGGLYFAVTLLWVALTACIKVPLNAQAYQKTSSSQYKAWAMAFFAFFRDRNELWRCSLLTFCGLALFAEHSWLYSFLVADCFCQNSALATVLAGIVAPAESWLMTFVGMALVTFVYAAVGFHCYQEEFGIYCDDNIVVCTLNILYQGSRTGVIGLSSMMDVVTPSDPGWGGRIVYDVSYFIVFGVMFLNAVVALVVDSFSAQRRAAEQRAHLLATEAFISGIDRKVIDAAAQSAGISDGFEYHENHMQNKWDYMSFIFHLQEKSEEDYTGPEQKIGKLLQDNEVKWLPLGKSKILAGEYQDLDVLSRINLKMESVDRELRSEARQRKALFATLNALSRSFSEKAANIDQEAKAVATAVASANARPNVHAFVNEMARARPATHNADLAVVHVPTGVSELSRPSTLAAGRL